MTSRHQGKWLRFPMANVTLPLSHMKKSRSAPRHPASGPGADSSSARPSSAPRTLPPRRKWAFRIAALVLSPLLVFGGLEAAFRFAGWGYPTSFFLPRESNGQAVLVENPRFSWRFFGPALARAPWPFQIPATKGPKTVRIFVLGESAAYGDPLPDFGLARLLEVLLRDRYPAAQFDVVNAAMTGINSHAILPIARDCARHQGDIWVIYMGNNEVVGPYGAGTVFGRQVPGLGIIRSALLLKTTRIGQMLDALLQRAGKEPTGRKGWEGMQMFASQQVGPDDPRMAAVYGHFERNLANILDVAQASQTRVVLATVASNLKDCAPFASLHRTGLTAAQQHEWERLFRAGVEAQQAGAPRRAVELFRDAAVIDAQFAALQFRWAQGCLALGQHADAADHFARARDCDALKFRTDSRLNDIMRKTAQERNGGGVFLADAAQQFAHGSTNAVPGKESFWEHVHLTFEGNYRLARLIAEQVARALPQWVTRDAPPRPWLSAAECAERLAHGDRSRYEATASMLMRTSDPPFTMQSNHDEQFTNLQAQLEQLRPAIQPAALQQAVTSCRQAIAQAPGDWILQKQLGRLLENAGDLAGAEAAWTQIVQSLPHSAMAHCGLASTLVRQKRLHEAEREYQTARRIEPHSAEALNGLALALALQGREQEALRVLEQLRKIRPESPETHLNLAMTLRALQRPAEAEPHFRFAIERRPSDPGFLNKLAKACAGLGWTNEAATAWSEALRLHPTDAPAHLSLGGLLAAMGRTDEAIEHYASAARLGPSQPEARFRLGTELARRGRMAEAREQLAAAVRLNPDFLQARLNLGILLAQQDRIEEALLEFQEALRIDPANAVARQYLETLHARPAGSRK
jgi:tetratricopeptide (TPR) repeat protein